MKKRKRKQQRVLILRRVDTPSVRGREGCLILSCSMLGRMILSCSLHRDRDNRCIEVLSSSNTCTLLDSRTSHSYMLHLCSHP